MTWCLLAIARVIIMLVPFSRIAKLMGEHHANIQSIPLLNEHQAAKAKEVRYVIAVASRYTFWDVNCFCKAITATVLLHFKSVPYVIFFGLVRDLKSQSIKAHSWVYAGSVSVAGGSDNAHYTVVGCFISANKLSVSA